MRVLSPHQRPFFSYMRLSGSIPPNIHSRALGWAPGEGGAENQDQEGGLGSCPRQGEQGPEVLGGRAEKTGWGSHQPRLSLPSPGVEVVTHIPPKKP